MSGSNYPPGTWEGDPRAPWNQGPEPCPECREDMDWDEDKEVWVCPEHGPQEEPEDQSDYMGIDTPEDRAAYRLGEE